MTLKRKFDVDSHDDARSNVKQLKLIPFPNFEPDMDVSMMDVEHIESIHAHIRLPSDASSCSTDYSDDSPVYPSFGLYPRPFFDGRDSSPTDSLSSSWDSSPKVSIIGLMQPSNDGNALAHHGTSCSQIPKLRLACASGLNGQRTMWSFCEQCGAISMVESD